MKGFVIDWQLVWTWVMQFALILVALGKAGPFVYDVVELAKGKIGERWGGVLAIVVSVALGTAGLIAAGQLTPDLLQPENFALLVITIWGASQSYYQKMKRKELKQVIAPLNTYHVPTAEWPQHSARE